MGWLNIQMLPAKPQAGMGYLKKLLKQEGRINKISDKAAFSKVLRRCAQNYCI